MKWVEALILFLPFTSAQIIFPGELETISSLFLPQSTSTSIPALSTSSVPRLTSSLQSTNDHPSSSISSSPTTILSSSFIPSSSLSFDSFTSTKPGAVSKASTIPVLSPSPVASNSEVLSTSSLQTIQRPPTFFPLHPGGPHVAPITPTPTNIPVTEIATIPGLTEPFDYEYDINLDMSFAPSASIFPISSFETAPLTPTPSLTSSSGFLSNTSSIAIQTDESDKSSTVSDSMLGIAKIENSSIPENATNNANSPKPGQSLDREHPSETLNTTHTVSNATPKDSLSTEIPTTEEVPLETPPNPENYDQLLVNAIITMGDSEGVNIGSNNTCITPLGENGTCTALKECAGYLPLADNVGDSIVSKFLRTRVCRLLPRSILFCCPDGKAILPLRY